MDRFEKARRIEKRYRFCERSRFFEHVFSRRIYGPLWWWFIFATYFFSVTMTREPGEPLKQPFFSAAAFLVLATVCIAVLLTGKARRRRWLQKQPLGDVPPVVMIGIRGIPLLCVAVVAFTILLR